MKWNKLSFMQVDAHAHQKSNSTQILVGVHTLGVHPWELSLPFERHEFDKKWEAITQADQVIYAVGECGLDRVHEGIADIEDQKYALLKHFELAQSKNIPLILHCVRSYSDVLQILKKIKFTLPVLLHAYGGNDYEMNELLKYNVFFSYGARLFNTDTRLKFTPMDRLLLETGDQDQYSIDDIYQKASVSLGIELKKLEGVIFKNFLTFFNKLDDISATDFIHDLNTRKTNR